MTLKEGTPVKRPAEQVEIVVFGATPGGIGAAIAAARRGRKTILVEPSPLIGGMMTSGLGRTDIRSLEAAGEIFREFTQRIVQHYAGTYGSESERVKQCNRGLWFEPSVARRVLWDMLAEEGNVAVRCAHDLVSAEVGEGRLHSITVRERGGRSEALLKADIFIDATYEGDLAALAGVPYVLGRESRDDWNEEYAGKLYMYFGPSKEVFPGSTGEGDRSVQAYNFRLCLTKDPSNRATITKPPQYRRDDYTSLLGDVAAGRVRSIGDVMNMLPVPNAKTDCNNHHYCMCSTDLPEENGMYSEGDRETREAVIRRHREYVEGLLWFLQHEEALPEPFRAEAREWGYAADEFPETGHFPPQIYVREARRIKGEYTFTENDARLAPGLDRAPIHFDSIAIGDYAIDSHATRKREPAGRDQALEGFLGLGWLTEVYQIPFGVMAPQRVDNLLAPVAVSATHMGFGTIRMEPCWMQLGFAAGVAADLSIAADVPVRAVPIDLLQDELLASGQRITFFKDVAWSSEARAAAEYFGAKGFFTSYLAKLEEPITVGEASRWIAHARSLLGGKQLPPLPATDRLLPVGFDMGPRLPREEPSPRQHWAANPALSLSMTKRWLQVANRAVGGQVTDTLPSEERPVTRGEFCAVLYRLLKSGRDRLPASAGSARSRR